MPQISDALKRSVDAQLDAGLPPVPTPGDGRNLLDLLRYTEHHWRYSLTAEVKRFGPSSSTVLTSRALNAFGVAVSICCKDLSMGNGRLWRVCNTTDDELRSWHMIFSDTLKYSDVSDWMNVLWKESAAISMASPTEFEFNNVDRIARAQEVAEWLFKTLRQTLPNPDIDQSWLKAELDKISVPNEQLCLQVPKTVLQRAHAWVQTEKSGVWRLAGSIQLDGFYLEDFKRVWLALCTVAAIHKFFWMTASSDTLLDIAVPVLDRPVLIAVLSELSGLDSTEVDQLVAYVTCDVARWGSGTSPDSVLQPLFLLADGKITFSPSVVLESNAERNILDLVNRKASKIYDGVKNTKEAQWTAELESRLSSYGLIAKPQLKYLDTAMDLMVISKDMTIGLCTEMKWLLVSDRVKGQNIEYLADGFKQAGKAADWSNNNKSDVELKLGLPANSLKGCTFYPVLLSKDTTLSGMVHNASVPIVCDIFFDWFVEKTNGDIALLWWHLQNGTHLPVEGQHFKERRSTIEFNGIKFHVGGFDEIEVSRWDPDWDIDVGVRHTQARSP